MMAVAASLSALTEELVATVAKVDQKDSPRFKFLKRRTEDALRSNAYPRTDQFAVAHQLEGLQEKFQVLNRDELADALRSRLAELEEHQSRWFPEILSLFLQLADRPAQRSTFDWIEKVQLKEVTKSLSWSELDGTGTAYCEEDIWETPDFAAGSSDDDLLSISSESSHRCKLPQDPITSDADYVIPEEVFSSEETDEDLLASVERVQFWRQENHAATQCEGVSSRVVTELHVVREAIFMLQGLPTSIFWHLDDGTIVVDRRYAVKHLSNESLSSLLRSLSTTGAQIDVLRRFVKTLDPAKCAPYVRTFNRGIEDCLNGFDKYLSDLQSNYLSEQSTASVSLLQLSDDVHRQSRLLLLLSSLVSDPQQKAQDNSARCLDLLYELVCMTQATGDDNEFIYLAKMFFACFETYARPIRTWMETGQLEESGAFFLLHNQNDSDLRTLWQNWYTLDDAALLRAPKFIQTIAQKIFITGKSRVFLRQLSVTEDAEHRSISSLSLEDVLSPDTSLCLPFSALFVSALGNLVDQNHTLASSLLRKELGEQCGLWDSLQSLDHIYLCKDMSVFGSIDDKIFDLIDRGRAAWSDRFLLTELAQSAFTALPFIDPSRLIVRSSHGIISQQSNHRSVSMLQAISLDYILPWPVANIITKESILRYQRISVFLMQIRRARQMIVKQHLQYADPTDRTFDDRSNALSFALRHNMLWFLNTLYSHLTDFVISTTTESLWRSFSEAGDVDSMIAAHRAYMSSIEDQCLLSKNLNPLHRATITLLDLCVSFADVQAVRHGRNRPDPTKVFYKHENSQIHQPGKRYLSDEDEDNDVYDSDTDDMDPSTMSLHETHYVDRLKDIKDQFHRLIAFMVAGLKGVGRADGQLSWEILAEKLEWRKEQLYS